MGFSINKSSRTYFMRLARPRDLAMPEGRKSSSSLSSCLNLSSLKKQSAPTNETYSSASSSRSQKFFRMSKRFLLSGTWNNLFFLAELRSKTPASRWCWDSCSTSEFSRGISKKLETFLSFFCKTLNQLKSCFCEIFETGYWLLAVQLTALGSFADSITAILSVGEQVSKWLTVWADSWTTFLVALVLTVLPSSWFL